ncbi:MAG: phospholipid/cholesterol/gamma-HCH transport system substrate-binding protein [Thermoleophilaceae bacterium]|jgi:virulence factor Mce-like protein|nr:phospholipid/cholesterol/gamma-HCH transport system substrate-binding protein [Thermoleophilaceae bacterium]
MAKKKTPASRPRGMSTFRFGLIATVVTVVAIYLAYAQPNPFASPFRFSAVFETAQNLAPGAPVRTAGVPVGSVSSVQPLPDGSGAARVELEITSKQGLPIHQDAELKVRPRIFLEGNLFVDLSPGSPSSPDLASGGTIPVNQTATPVSLGDVLTSLQGNTRKNLQTLFQEYGRNALGGGGAEGFNKSIKYWEDAYRDLSIANGATLGTEPGDLGDVIAGQQKVAAALTKSPDELASLVTNFNRFAGALASHESALSAAIPALRNTVTVGRPALQSVNDTLPGVNSFATAALPAARSSADTIPKLYPFVHQTRLLFSKPELRGLAQELRPTVPELAKLNPETVRLLQQARALSRCQNRVLVPWANDTNWEDAGNDGPAGGPNGQSGEPPFHLFPRSLEGLSGESRENDANSPVFRVLGLGGAETVVNFLEPELTPIFGTNPFTVNAVQPASPLDADGVLADPPAHRPDVPCEDQQPPNLHAAVGKPPIVVSSAGKVSGTPAPGTAAKVAEFAKGQSNMDNEAPANAAEVAARLQPKIDKMISELSSGQLKKLEPLGVYGPSTLTKDNLAQAMKDAGQ